MNRDGGTGARVMTGGRFGAIHLGLTFAAAASTSFAASLLNLPGFLPRLVFVAGVFTLPLSFGFGYLKGRSKSQILQADDEQVEVLERKLELLEQERDFYRDFVVDTNVPVSKPTAKG